MDRKLRLAALVAVLAVAGCDRQPVDQPAVAATPPAPTSAYAFTFDYMHARQDVGDPGKVRAAAEGAFYVVVHYAIQNTGSAPVPVPDMIPLVLRDGQGRTYSADPDATALLLTEANIEVDPVRTGDLNPGVSHKTAAVFEIDRTAWQFRPWHVQPIGLPNASVELPALDLP